MSSRCKAAAQVGQRLDAAAVHGCAPERGPDRCKEAQPSEGLQRGTGACARGMDGEVSVDREGQAGPSDAALLTAIAKRDDGAFRTLMLRHLSAVVATARRILRDDGDSEDVAQEVFLKLWNGADQLELGAIGARPWLRRVAMNVAIDRLRKSRRLDVTDAPPEQSAAPDQLAHLGARDTAAAVEEALRQLPERQRVALSLFHFEELSQRDVAELMDVSEDALESLLARGRRKLRDLLRDEWQELVGPEAEAP